MYHFTIKDIDQESSQCIPCCCESLSMKPGSTNKVAVNYAPWAVPIGRLHCLPAFDLEQKDTCGTTMGAPVKVDGNPVAFDTPVSTMLSGDLNTKIVDPENGVLKFKALGLYGPKNGIAIVNSDGTFEYHPMSGYQGEDRFFITATDPANNSTTFEVLIGVGTTSSVDMTETPHVSIDNISVNVDYKTYTATFAVKVAPTADLCEVWRLTVQMQSIDCECVCFDRTDCFDIRMVKC